MHTHSDFTTKQEHQQRAPETDVPYCSIIFLISMYSESILMDLDLKYIAFFVASILIILVLAESSRILDDIDLEDSKTIVDIEILNVALSDLSQLEN